MLPPPFRRVYSSVVTGMSTCPSCHAQFKNKTTCKVCGANVRFLRFQDKIENNIVRDQYSHRAVRACMSASLEVASAENVASQGPSGISQRAMREDVHEEHVASVRAILFEPSFVCVHDAAGLLRSNFGALRPRNHKVRRESALLSPGPLELRLWISRPLVLLLRLSFDKPSKLLQSVCGLRCWRPTSRKNTGLSLSVTWSPR